MIFCSYFIGFQSGVQILIKRRNKYLVGVLAGIIVILLTASISGWKGYFEEGIYHDYGYNNPFNEYVVNPFLSITIIGLIPAILTGLWFGKQIGKQIKN
jgi:hypothetical protein